MQTIGLAIEEAEGFLTLGMGVEAWEILEGLPPEAKNHPRVLEIRLEILCHEKEWQKAAILGESLVSILPESAEAHYWLAVAHCKSGDEEGAKVALKRAIELDAGLRLKALDEPLLAAVW